MLKSFKDVRSHYALISITVRFASAAVLGTVILYLVPHIISNPSFNLTPYNVLVTASAFIILAESIVAIDLLLEKIIPIDDKNIRKRSAIQFLASLLAGVLVFLLYYYILFDRSKMSSHNEIFLYSAIAMSLLVYIIHVSLTERITKKYILASKQIESLKLEKMNMSYKALQDQLNPHFLFNNLSILKSLVFLKNDKVALQFIQNLSGVYRYVLRGHDIMTIKLREEIDFIKQYIALHQERLGEGLSVQFNINEDHLDLELPPMTLQLLVENAIKHNIADKEKVLTIYISTTNELLVVENNIQLKDVSYSTNMGLDNLVTRFTLLTDKPLNIEKTNDKFKISVPLLKPESKIHKSLDE